MTDPLLARGLAADVVGRVLRSGAYSNVLVDRVGSGLDPSDRARLKALTFGVLRHLETIDEHIRAVSERDTIDPAVLDRLRIIGFELLFGDVPDPIAVSAGVDLIRESNRKAAGFANAVLRRIAGTGRREESGLRLPDWLGESLGRAWSREEVRAFADASAMEPDRVARTRPGSQAAGDPFPEIEGAFRLPPGPLPAGMVIQDAASIAVGNAVEARQGMSVVDLAAAPGGKTMHLVDQVGERGRVTAVDRHLRRARDAARRVPTADWVVGDAVTPPLRPGRFERVLLDAPCSGLGTLRRRPEIRLRVGEGDIAGLAERQRRMVEAALRLLAPGGLLVYSVCTVTPEETVDVVTGLGFEPPSSPGRVWGEGRLLAPHITNTDGMFVAVHRS